MIFTLAMSSAQERRHDRRNHDMMRHAEFGMGLVEKNLIHLHMLQKAGKEIGITGQQEEKLHKMQQVHQESVIRQEAELKVAEMKFKNLLMEEKVERAKVEGMIREIAKMKTDLMVQKINFLLDIKAVLTPEQIAKLDEMKKKRMNDMMERRCNRMEREECLDRTHRRQSRPKD